MEDNKITETGIDFLNNNWENVNYSVLDDKIKSEKCSECIFFNTCPGVWKEYVELYGILDIKPIKK